MQRYEKKCNPVEKSITIFRTLLFSTPQKPPTGNINVQKVAKDLEVIEKVAKFVAN